MILPVKITCEATLDKGVEYCVWVECGGIRVVKRRKKKAGQQAKSRLRAGALWKLLLQGKLFRILRMLEWRQVEVALAVSRQDAAQTALLAGVSLTIGDALMRCLPFPLRVEVQANLSGVGTVCRVRCIACARAGILSAAALRLWMASVTQSKSQTAEEEPYAASH